MAWSYIGGAENSNVSAATSVTITHGLTINADDLVIIYCNANDTAAMSIDTGGAAWTEAVDETPASETAHHACYWKSANGSEPSSYTVNHGNAESQILIKVFRGTGPPSLDASANTSRSGTNQNDLVIDAVGSQTVSNNCVSIVMGGKDNRFVAGRRAYVTATDSYASPIGDNEDQASGMAHRIYGAAEGKTFGASDTVVLEDSGSNDGMNDRTYSVHISFLEGVAGAANPKGPLGGLVLAGPFGGPIGPY